jgi:hypothetical protein
MPLLLLPSSSAAVVVCHQRRPPPPPLLSTAAMFRSRSHYHHSAVSTISHRPLSSFSIAARCPILRVVIVRHRCHSPPLLSAIAVPLLALSLTSRCWLLRYVDLLARLWQSLVGAVITSHPPVLPTLACSPRHLLPQSASACCCWTLLVLPSSFRCWLLRCRRQKYHLDQPTTGYLWRY